MSQGLVASITALGLSVATVPTLVHAAEPEVPEPAAGSEAAPEREAIRAAVLPLAVEGEELPEADRDELTGRLVEGLRRGQFDVIAPSDVLAAAPAAATCRAPDCYTSIAAAAGATHVVRFVVKAQDRDYQVEVVLVDGKSGAQVASSADSCQICGVAEVGDILDAAAATLRTKLDNLAQGPATLVVASSPAGARVSIDGELKGVTPFNAPVLAGKHVLRISLDGYITVEREVTFVEGIEETQSFELEKVPSRLPARPWGWVSLGVGIAGVGTAVAFAALDDEEAKLSPNKCVQGPADDDGDCPRLWDLDWALFGTAIAGAALTTLGVAILLNSAKRRTKKSAVDKGTTAWRSPKRPRVGIGFGSVTIRGRF